MSYKLKSFVYFLSFIAATFIYIAMDHNDQSHDNNTNEEIAALNIEQQSLEQPIVLK